MMSGGFRKWTPAHQKLLTDKWNAFLLKRYRSADGLTKAWGELKPGEDPTKGSVEAGPIYGEVKEFPNQRASDFLEFIQDVLPKLPREREIRILDFGCGKSYLTFAMYYYLHELQGLDVRILGLDLKEDVIRACNQLSQRYGYEKLRFLEGNIADYTGADEVDMVVTLHACDTATDFALAKAVGWKAKVILSVPCCQHELNGQMENELLRPILQYGLIKERLAALVTDGLRAQYLEREGYDVQVLEFIDMEHTPKNILLRAVRTGRKGENGAAIQACEEFFHVSPTLGKLLDHKGDLQ